MNKKFSMFLVATTSGAVATLALAVFLFSPLRANAYAVGPLEPSTQNSVSSSSATVVSYDFGSSFQDLVSPFTNFFRSMQSSGGVVSIGAGSTVPGMTISVNTQPYVSQFDAWFYGVTGVHIESFTNIVINFFSWLFGMLGGVVAWIANSLKGVIH